MSFGVFCFVLGEVLGEGGGFGGGGRFLAIHLLKNWSNQYKEYATDKYIYFFTHTHQCFFYDSM